MATVVGVFDSEQQAEKAVRAMRDGGFKDNEISIVAKRQGNEGGGQGGEGDQEQGDDFGLNMGMGDLNRGVGWGSTLGGVGGLLAGVGALAIPGIGPIVAAGPIAAGLSGAVGGGLAGGLVDLGVPEDEGQQLEQDVKQGSTLALVKADMKRSEEASKAMKENGAREVKVHMNAS